MATPNLFGILYSSEALIEFDSPKLNQLTAHSSRKNSQVGITGFLYIEGQNFLQYLEGESSRVRDLVDKIAADERHLVGYTHVLSIEKRKFPIWNMKQVDSTQAQTLRIESLLMEILDLMKNPQVMNTEYKEKMILRMLDRLSASQKQLSVG